jgi:hypothetical protein
MKYLKLFEEFDNKEEVLDWMYSNGILSKNGRSLNMILPDMIKCVLVEE